jgi:hypothetical protein
MKKEWEGYVSNCSQLIKRGTATVAAFATQMVEEAETALTDAVAKCTAGDVDWDKGLADDCVGGPEEGG